MSASANTSVTLPATVEKIIPPFNPDEPEKAQIENTLTDETGAQVRLKKGAEVEVTVEAPPGATTAIERHNAKR
jgi:hypothetical protein